MSETIAGLKFACFISQASKKSIYFIKWSMNQTFEFLKHQAKKCLVFVVDKWPKRWIDSKNWIWLIFRRSANRIYRPTYWPSSYQGCSRCGTSLCIVTHLCSTKASMSSWRRQARRWRCGRGKPCFLASGGSSSPSTGRKLRSGGKVRRRSRM